MEYSLEELCQIPGAKVKFSEDYAYSPGNYWIELSQQGWDIERVKETLLDKFWTVKRSTQHGITIDISEHFSYPPESVYFLINKFDQVKCYMSNK